jgi:hypothetical protein
MKVMKRNNKHVKEFKKIVYVAGTEYVIRDEHIYKHYEIARKLVRDKNEIVGFKLNG